MNRPWFILLARSMSAPRLTISIAYGPEHTNKRMMVSIRLFSGGGGRPRLSLVIFIVTVAPGVQFSRPPIKTTFSRCLGITCRAGLLVSPALGLARNLRRTEEQGKQTDRQIACSVRAFCSNVGPSGWPLPQMAANRSPQPRQQIRVLTFIVLNLAAFTAQGELNKST